MPFPLRHNSGDFTMFTLPQAIISEYVQVINISRRKRREGRGKREKKEISNTYL